MDNKIYISLIVIVMISGCYVHSAGYNDLDFNDENIHMNNNTFRISGSLKLSRNAGSVHDYRNISLVFYDRNKQKMKTVSLGNMSTNPDRYPNKLQFNITHDTVPKYILVESPDFWDDNDIVVTGLIIRNGTYYRFSRGGSDDTKFPCMIYDLTIDAVHC